MSDLDITPPYFDRTQEKNLILQNFIETLNNTQTNLSNIDMVFYWPFKVCSGLQQCC